MRVRGVAVEVIIQVEECGCPEGGREAPVPYPME